VNAPRLTGLPVALAAVLTALTACAPPDRAAAPLDRLTFPTGLAVHDGRLVAVSSNFDLTYEADRGGSVMAIAADASLGGVPRIDGAVRIPSYGGEVAVADPTTCGLPTAQVVAVSRQSRTAFVLGLDAAGALSCGPGCELPVGQGGGLDPYGVALACQPGRAARAFVTFLRSEDGLPRLAEIALGDPPSLRTGVISNARGSTHALAYDAVADRLFFGGLENGTKLAWLDLAGGCQIGGTVDPCAVQDATLATVVRGAAVRGLAFGNPRVGQPRRLYAAATMYDPDLEASSGFRLEIGGALLVLELDERPTGLVSPRFLRAVPMGFGTAEVRVLPALPGSAGDLVVVSASEAGELWIYDGELDVVASVIGRSASTGEPLLGRRPFALAVEPRGGVARVYVGSFEEGFVTAVDVDLSNPGGAAIVPGRIAEVTR
jgi:hypothetical protein